MSYPIIEIDPEWVVEQEWLGTKGKYWIRIEDHETLRDNRWLFKYPKVRDEENPKDITGMHWSEKIAYELSRTIKILSPVVELATLGGDIGSLTQNFANEGYSLYHGNQVLAKAHPNYDADKIQRQNDHKISSIMDAIGGVFIDSEAGEKARHQFAQYLIFDALICNVDRHHENWGFLRKQVENGYKGRLAPSYDHASSLGRELVDKHTENFNKKSCYSLLKDPTGIERYIQNGRGPIYVDGTGNKGPSPMKLVKRCLEIPELAPYFKKGLQRLEWLENEKFRDIINKVPDIHMSELSKDFAYRLLCVTLKQLNELRSK